MSIIGNINIEAISVFTSQTAPAFSRGSYGELYGRLFDTTTQAALETLRACLPGEFAEFDRKGRGDSLNLDLYGWDPEDRVGVVQVRMASRRYRNGFLNVRKDYVLCGFNENGTPFRHPVSAQRIRGAINAGAGPMEVIRAAQRWMWGCTEKQLAESFYRRQGDVLMVAERGQPKGELIERGTEATLAETHVVRAERLVRIKGKPHLWALRPVLSHTKGEHRDVRHPLTDTDGWFTVRVADTAPAWDYSQRLGD
jgi:hypothetical protein